MTLQGLVKGAGRCLLVWAVCLLPLMAWPAAAQAQNIQVRTVTPDLVETGPGVILTLSFRVVNRGQDPVQLRETLKLPEGWQLVMPLFEFFLGPGREITRLAVVQVGRTAGAKDYTIAYTVTDLQDYALTDTVETRVVVRPIYDLSVLLEGRAPEQVIAGEPFTFQARVLNRGNADLDVTVQARDSDKTLVTVDPKAFALAAGQSRVLSVTARGDPSEHRLQRHHIRLEATTGLEVDGQPVQARLNVPVDVVPLVAGQDMYHRYPLEFVTGAGMNDDDMAVQFTLKGSGYIDEARTRQLDFLVRAPDNRNYGVLSRRDEYWMRYREPAFGFQAGDRSYALSQLTSWYRYGRGAGADLHPGNWPAGGGVYYVEDRWALQKRKDTAGYLSYSPLADATLRLNLINQAYEPWENQPAVSENIISVQGDATVRENDLLEAEIGYSTTDRDKTGSDAAWRLGYRGQAFGDFRYMVSGRRAEPDFAGRYGDTALYSGTATFPLIDRIRGNLSYSRYESNLEKDPDRGTAPREDLYRSGVSVRLPGRWTMNLDYDFYERYDDQPDPDFSFREHGARLGLGRSTGNLSYRGEVRRSWTEDRLIDDSYAGWNYTLSATYRPARTFFLSFYGGFGDDRSPSDSRLLRQGRNLGGSAHWQPTQDLSMYLNYSTYDQNFPDQPLRERTESENFGAGIRYRLPNQHRLEVSARRTEGTASDTYTTYMATYTIPFALPLGRKKSVGALEGHVYRSDEPGAPGVADAVVYVDGTAARTDGKGKFVFKTLPPGEYEVRLDERTIGLDAVPAGAGTLKVAVTGATTSGTDIPLTRAGTVSGQIVMVPAQGNNPADAHFSNGGNATAPVDTGPDREAAREAGRGLGNLLVELSRPEETRRTVSDGNGAFLFERLVPGEWTLKVFDHNLPALHHLEHPTTPVTIRPGEDRKILVRVLPRLREIRFIDEGRVTMNLNQ